MNLRQNKILGSLLGGAVGDSMGAVTEHTSRRILEERYGFITEIIEPHERLRKHGHVRGLVTDDFSVAYYSAQPMIENKCHVNFELAKEGLLRWNSDPRYSNCAGPTTIVAINKLKGIAPPPSKLDKVLCINSRVTNGGGMKSGIIGLFNPNDMDRTIDETITLCSLTHDNTLALSAACAISAAVSKAFADNCSYYDLIEAGIYGADEGYRRSLGKVRPVAGCNIAKKIALAAQIGLDHQDDPRKAMEEIADIIGCGLYAYESIPAAFGYIAATKGQVMDSIYLAVNAGDDTDTVACMTGFITGAFCSADMITPGLLELIDEVNGFDLRKTALAIDEIVEKGE